MSIPYELKIVPALTFRPLSPLLAQQIENAYRDLAEDAIRPTERAAVTPISRVSPSESTTTLDLRA